MDPGLANSGTYLLQNIWEGLLDFDEQGNPIPLGATSWDISPDGSVYTFHLRDGVKWSDGTPVTARDYEWTWKRNEDPKTASSYAQALYVIKGAQAYNKGTAQAADMGVKALDDKTLQVNLESPVGYFLRVAASWTAYALPRQAIEKFGPKWTEPENVVVNGPFKIDSWKHDQQIVLTRNEQYWGRRTILSKVVVPLSSDIPRTSLAAYEANELDVAVGPWPADADRIEKHPTLGKELRFFEGSQCTFMVCDVSNSQSPVSKLPFRQALYLSIDRERIAGDVLKKVGVPTYTMVPGDILGNNPNARIPGGVKEAQAALASAGYPSGNGAPALTITYPQSAVFDLLMQVLQEMWGANLGLKFTLNPMERRAFNSWRSALKIQQYDLHLSTWGSDYLDPFNWHNFLFSSKTDYYNSHWVDAEFDRLVDLGARETDQNKRKELHQQAEGILVKSATFIPIYRAATPYLFKPWVADFLHKSIGFDRFAPTRILQH
jgi:oligopeptide transport system substrate-binding protein